MRSVGDAIASLVRPMSPQDPQLVATMARWTDCGREDAPSAMTILVLDDTSSQVTRGSDRSVAKASANALAQGHSCCRRSVVLRDEVVSRPAVCKSV